MEAAASRSSRGFDEEEDDDQEFGRREGSSSQKDLNVKLDGKGSGTDDIPITPRSKHSAMEQRRRNKINDRFQILRELIPHTDQKRDKASFLLEVIEYIRFLQEKAQKYEASYPGWNEENAKLMPWLKVYYRSFWKNAQQNNNQIPVEGFPYPSQAARNGSPAFSGQFDGGNNIVAPPLVPNAQNPAEPDTAHGASYKMETAAGFDNNMPSHAQSHWLGSTSPVDCSFSGEMLNVQEDLVIDEGTINASASYSHGFLTTLTQALQSSGVDLSQARISVQINLGKRAISKRPGVGATFSNSKIPVDSTPTHQAVAHSKTGKMDEESLQPSKRHKTDNS